MPSEWILKKLLEEEDSEKEHADLAHMTRTEDDSEVDLTSEAESEAELSSEDESDSDEDEVLSLFTPSELKASIYEMLKKFDAFLIKI